MNANKSLIFGLINRGLVLGRCGAGSGCRQLAEVTDPARVFRFALFLRLNIHMKRLKARKSFRINRDQIAKYEIKTMAIEDIVPEVKP